MTKPKRKQAKCSICYKLCLLNDEGICRKCNNIVKTLQLLPEEVLIAAIKEAL